MTERALVRLVLFVDDEQPGVISCDVSVGLPVGDITAAEVQLAAGVTVDRLGAELEALWAAARAETN